MEYLLHQRAFGALRSVIAALPKIFQFVFVAFFLVSCASRAGIDQFVAYRSAFDESRAASESMFDVLEISERNQQQLAASSGGGFDPDMAKIFSDAADPPLTDAYRRAFAAISRYNEVMVGLALGETANSLSTELGAMAADGLGFATAAFPSIGTTSLSEFIPVFQQIARTALTQHSRAVFVAELAENVEPVLQLMAVMRAHTVEVFYYLRADGQAEERRQMLSNWVILLDRNSKALRVASDAAQNGSRSRNLSAIHADLAEMNAASTALRKSIAKLASN